MKKCLAAFLIILPLCAQDGRGSRHLLGLDRPLTAPSGRSARAIAQDFIHAQIASELSLTDVDLAGLYVAKEYETAHNGVTHLIYKQQFSGITVYNAEWVVNVAADGSVLNAGGTLFSAPPPDAVLPDTNSAMRAARAAVRAVSSKAAANYFPMITGTSSLRNGVRLAGGDLPDDLEGQLIWYGGSAGVKPAWVFYVTDTDGVNRYATVIDDASQSLMSKTPLTFFQSPSAPKGQVFERESPQPSSTPGVFLTVAPPFVDRTMQSFAGDPVASPNGWVIGNQTAGNNVVVGENLLGTGFLRTPDVTTAPDGNFSFPLQLGPGAPSPLAFKDAANTNLFYWMNRAHDLHYASGFDEAAGNYQASSMGRGGTDGDPIYAYTHYGAAARQSAQLLNAFFSTRSANDGSPSMVAMFLSQSNNSDFFTDGSYDSLVMVHEYTHGVSFRLARQVYSTFQGASMGEAWSDFYGLEYTTPSGAPADGTYAEGQYFDQSWGSGDLRSRPVSTNMSVNPLTFANLGHVESYSPEVHAEGEIWVESLWEVRANLIQQFGEAEGRRRARMLVMDGMKLEVPAATMVDARDAILLADQADFKGASQNQIWAAFAKRGLGALAYASSANSVHVVPSFDLPSSTGQLKFYDDPIVIGEPAVIVLQDSSLTRPSVRVQVTSSSGDLEDVLLFKNGLNYVGSIRTTGSPGAQQNSVLSLATGDAISAFYPHFGASGNQLVSATAGTRLSYTRIAVQPSFTFGTERRLTLNGASTRVDLPFQFPYFSNKYGYVLVHQNGLLSFDVPLSTSCTDGATLATVNGMAPLFANLSTNGIAQPKEGVYMSQSSSDSVTFHWVGETVTPFARPGHPVNFSATLFQTGRTVFSYDPTSNADLNFDATFFGCGLSPGQGLSNGHGSTISGLVFVLDTTDGFGGTVNWDPPFGAGSIPVAKLESPTAGQQVQGILTVSGIAYDAQSPIVRIDVYIDGVIRGLTTPTVSRPDFCTGANASINGCPRVGFTLPLDLAGLGLSAGNHTVSLRVSNSRAAFTDVAPVTFNLTAGQSQLPRAKIESPANGATVSGNITVVGWALADTLRVTAVDLLIDGITYGPASYGLGRTDVCTAQVTSPNCPNVGFRVSVGTHDGFPLLLDGQHTMKVRVLDQTGRFTVLDDSAVTFTVKNGADSKIIGAITTPKNNDTLSGTVTITGYAYSPNQKIIAGIILIDGDTYSAATVRVNQPAAAACATLPDVPQCPNIGFTVNLDTTHFQNGPHILGMLIVNDAGQFAIIPNISNAGMNVTIQN